MAMRVVMRLVVLLGAAVMVVVGPMSASAGAAEVYFSGRPTVAGAITMQIGDTYYDDTRATLEESWAGLRTGVDLYRIAPVFRGDLFVFRLTSKATTHHLCIVDESVATQPCSLPITQVWEIDGPTQLTVRAATSMARPMVRVQGGGQFSLVLLSRQRPLTLSPYIYARGQRTDAMQVRARTSITEPAPDGLPCQMVVVGPDPSDRFTYRSRVSDGRVVFAMSLPTRLHGRTVGYLVSCDGATTVAGASFEVVVK
jgi:hypothetical protein